MTTNQNERSDALSYYLHQDNMIWNRVQTMGVIQVAALGAAYGQKLDKPIAYAALLLGALLTVVVFALLNRDMEFRHAIRAAHGEFHPRVDRRWFAPLKGREAAWIVFALLLVADVVLGWFIAVA